MRAYIFDEMETLAARLDEALAQLPPDRRAKALRHKQAGGQLESTAAWLLLRHALAHTYNIKEVPAMAESESGKPYFAERTDIHFNLSHCREAVACVVGAAPVGIDIERIRPYKESLARYTLSDSELQEVADGNPPADFTRLWTMKESRVKMTGQGIQPRGLKTLLCDQDECREGGRYVFTTLQTDRYICTVCAGGSCEIVTIPLTTLLP